VAVTFVDWEDMPRWRLIDKSLGLDIPEPPETYHTSPYLFTDLGIPTDVTSTLPTADRTRVGLSAEIEEDLGGGRRKRIEARSRPGSRSRPGGPATTEEAPRPARQRQRRRGEPTAAGDTPSTVDAPPPAAASDDSPAKPRRRRRRRGGGGGPVGGTDTD
jgi:hypothetical protein